MSDSDPNLGAPAPENENPKPRPSGCTGPKTLEGKNNSRRNSLKHGLTATILTLPDENPEHIKTYTESWLETCQPETAAEAAAVSEAALAMLHLERFHKAHQANTANQARYAATDWDTEQNERLAQAVKLLPKKPGPAVAQLKAFGTGVKWLITRWEQLREILRKQGCWNNAGLRCQVIHLLGYRAYKLRSAPVEAFELYMMALYALPEGPPPHVLDQARKELMPPEFLGLYGPDFKLERPDALAGLLMFLTIQITQLKALSAVFEPLDAQSRAEASVRAMAPQDTPRNKLQLRYQTASSTAFSRAVKTLQSLQAERKKAEAAAEGSQTGPPTAPAEGSKAGLRNELPDNGFPPYPALENGTCVRSGGTLHLVQKCASGQWLLTAIDASGVDVPLLLPSDVVGPPAAAG